MPPDRLARIGGERPTCAPRGVRQKFDPGLVAGRHPVSKSDPSRRLGGSEAQKAQSRERPCFRSIPRIPASASVLRHLLRASKVSRLNRHRGVPLPCATWSRLPEPGHPDSVPLRG